MPCLRTQHQNRSVFFVSGDKIQFTLFVIVVVVLFQHFSGLYMNVLSVHAILLI